MKKITTIWMLFCCSVAWSNPGSRPVSFEFFGEKISFNIDTDGLPTCGPMDLNVEKIQAFYASAKLACFSNVIDALLRYKEYKRPDDWLFYQLVRKTAQQLSPKSANYLQYTLYKWFFMVESGYDVLLTVSTDKVLFYVQSNENIYNIPARMKDGKQYVCLNYHDYGNIDFAKNLFKEVPYVTEKQLHSFSYLVTQLPNFNAEEYAEKDLRFTYENREYNFKVKVNREVQSIFVNYPVVDYNYSFNIPLSSETYASLIPALKKSIKGLSTKSGVDYLMKFTRYAFGYEKDMEQFGKEKRLTPEETLLYNQSDCEDRAALFFYLVKEIYDLPMIVLSYPTHVTVAVHFKNASGKPIIYQGNKYYICEPTPQAKDLQIGQSVPSLANSHYDIAYSYSPSRK